MDSIAVAKNVLLTNMGVQKGETILIVTDMPMEKLGKQFFKAAEQLDLEAMQVIFLPRKSNGEEPPESVAVAMKNASVAMLLTTCSLSHTKARREASHNGCRIASMPGLTEDMLLRTLKPDYGHMQKKCSRLAEILTKGQQVRIETALGTQLTFSIEGRVGRIDDGDLRTPGAFGNLPAGEVYIAPVEGSAQGIIVFDGSFAGVGRLTQPITVTVQDGLATTITGGQEAETLRNLIEPHGEKARNIAELGIGTHPLAKLTGFVLEDEKIAGTIHIALGDNSTFGGQIEVSSHLDGVICKPSLFIDGEDILL